jgi:hypothetical protein
MVRTVNHQAIHLSAYVQRERSLSLHLLMVSAQAAQTNQICRLKKDANSFLV